jgi:FliI/YscN family ATPase
VIRLDAAREAVARARVPGRSGVVVDVSPGLLRCRGTGAFLGERVRVARPGAEDLAGEVAALRAGEAVVLPLGDARGVVPGAPVRPTGRRSAAPVGDGILGRVLDATGRPIDGRPLPAGLAWREVDGAAPAPLDRPGTGRPLSTGVRAVDAFATLAEGQRVGLFAGPGAGQSTLLGRLVRGASADACVVALVGERGREVREMVEGSLGPAVMPRTVVVAATSDEPALRRMRAAQVATSIAEWLARERGLSVMLVVDSLTRFARAVREVGLAAGEPPVRQGFPARVFAELPRLVERAGTGPGKPITAVYTVLSTGDAAEDPISAEIQGLLDGHVVLDRRIAEAGRHPAVDVLASLSRLMPAVVPPEHLRAAARVRRAMARWEAGKETVLAGAWARGADPAFDAAAAGMPAVEAFLRQEGAEATPMAECLARLLALAGRFEGPEG